MQQDRSKSKFKIICIPGAPWPWFVYNTITGKSDAGHQSAADALLALRAAKAGASTGKAGGR